MKSQEICFPLFLDGVLAFTKSFVALKQMGVATSNAKNDEQRLDAIFEGIKGIASGIDTGIQSFADYSSCQSKRRR